MTFLAAPAPPRMCIDDDRGQLMDQARASGRIVGRSLIAALSGAAALLAGCASGPAGPPLAIDEELPPTFMAAPPSYGEIDERWWESFGEPTLNALVERAVLGNPTIDQAIARVRQARAEARRAGADLVPNVNATVGATQGEGNEISIDPDVFDAGIEISWEVDLWGRLSAAQAAEQREFVASAADLQAVRQLIAAETARTYFTAIEAQSQVELARRALETYDELTRQLNLRVERGVTAQSIASLAVSDSESARAGLEQREEDYERLIRRLEILVGDYPGGAAAIAASLPEIPPIPPTGVPAELVARRPDIRSARLAIEAAGYRVDSARASFLPSLTLTGSAGASAAAFANLFDPVSLLWSIAGRILQPIFQGGRLRAELDLRQGERDEAIGAYAETALQALFEVETALAVDDDLAAQEQAFDRSAAAAEQAVEIFGLRYRVGVDSFYNVLESQQRALDARSGYLAARRARLVNRIDLHLALGGGFEEAPETAVAAAVD